MENNIQIGDYPEFENTLEKLELSIPTGIAILPNNLDTANSVGELVYASEAPTVRVLWRNSGIDATNIEPPDVKIPQISQKSDNYIIPTIFIAYSFLSENPKLVSIALGVVSNYLTDYFKGLMRKPDVKFDIVIQTGKNKYKRIQYEGSQEGIKYFANILDEVSLDE